MPTTNKKYFLDLGGLSILWNKIKSTFADKQQTDSQIGNLTGSLTNLTNTVTGISNDLDTLEITVLNIAPKEANTYTAAVEASKSLASGTVIRVLNEETDSSVTPPITYRAGMYIVVAAGDIQYITTSSGDESAEGIEGLTNKVNALDRDVIKKVVAKDSNGNSLGNYTVTDNTLVIVHDDVVDVDSNSVRTLTHKAVAAKFKEMQNTISSLPKFKVDIVDELPDSDISTSTIYLVRNLKSTDRNLYTEWLYVEKVVEGNKTYVWEKLGEQTLDINNVVTNSQLTEAINTALASYAKEAEIKQYVTDTVGTAQSSILSTVESTYVSKEFANNTYAKTIDVNNRLKDYETKDNAAATYLTKSDASNIYLSKVDSNLKGWMTKADIISSMQSDDAGSIGNAVSITSEQLDEIFAK